MNRRLAPSVLRMRPPDRKLRLSGGARRLAFFHVGRVEDFKRLSAVRQLRDRVDVRPLALARLARRSVIQKRARPVAKREVIAFADDGGGHAPHLAGAVGKLDLAAVSENEYRLVFE